MSHLKGPYAYDDRLNRATTRPTGYLLVPEREIEAANANLTEAMALLDVIAEDTGHKGDQPYCATCARLKALRGRL